VDELLPDPLQRLRGGRARLLRIHFLEAERLELGLGAAELGDLPFTGSRVALELLLHTRSRSVSVSS
jgi:hypothetical protein